ncbi:hypothetical protein [Haloarcula sp. JP-L23]|uniref:hypothetical protein n=1 Tax=Haloarcula sp. JP-L23 TaxID=2716717 RepID=UPI00140F319E|nr:hypothetical protein G9465_08615 [Haloarcula sp. JP-L23]
MKANLTCYRSACHGEFAPTGAGDDALYRCELCGAELEQTGVERLAEDDGPVGQLAQVLLEGAQ